MGQNVALHRALTGEQSNQHPEMSVKKRTHDDPNESGKLDVYRDLEERVLKDVAANASEVPPPADKPGKSIIEAAVAARDTALLRSIAAERKGLNDEQRRALLLLSDLLDRASRPRH